MWRATFCTHLTAIGCISTDGSIWLLAAMRCRTTKRSVSWWCDGLAIFRTPSLSSMSARTRALRCAPYARTTRTQPARADAVACTPARPHARATRRCRRRESASQWPSPPCARHSPPCRGSMRSGGASCVPRAHCTLATVRCGTPSLRPVPLFRKPSAHGTAVAVGSSACRARMGLVGLTCTNARVRAHTCFARGAPCPHHMASAHARSQACVRRTLHRTLASPAGRSAPGFPSFYEGFPLC